MARSRFARDEDAAFSWWTVLQIALLLIIPVGLFIFWYQYLRRIGADEAAREGPWASKPQAKVMADPNEGYRTCSKCGLRVRPAKSSGPPTCPNCMNTL